jgi:hypothetical protein
MAEEFHEMKHKDYKYFPISAKKINKGKKKKNKQNDMYEGKTLAIDTNKSPLPITSPTPTPATDTTMSPSSITSPSSLITVTSLIATLENQNLFLLSPEIIMQDKYGLTSEIGGVLNLRVKNGWLHVDYRIS